MNGISYYDHHRNAPSPNTTPRTPPKSTPPGHRPICLRNLASPATSAQAPVATPTGSQPKTGRRWQSNPAPYATMPLRFPPPRRLAERHAPIPAQPPRPRPLPDSRAVMAGARPVRLPAGSGHRPEMAPVDGEPGQHREPAQRDEVGRRRVRQRGCGPGCRGRRRTGNGRHIRLDCAPLRHPRGAGAGEAVARWRICADPRVVGVTNPEPDTQVCTHASSSPSAAPSASLAAKSSRKSRCEGERSRSRPSAVFAKVLNLGARRRNSFTCARRSPLPPR